MNVKYFTWLMKDVLCGWAMMPGYIMLHWIWFSMSGILDEYLWCGVYIIILLVHVPF
jgi:hypothetical protein